MDSPELPLDSMHERHTGLTPAVAASFLEAARVSLDRNHKPPQEFVLRHDSSERRAVVRWLPADDRCRRAWANRDDATRDGAYACALAAGELVLGLYAVSRAETLTGADYYIAPVHADPEDLEQCFRLEVSGTHQDEGEVRRRLRDKLAQARKGRSNLPAIAAVVGYRVRVISMLSMQSVAEEP